MILTEQERTVLLRQTGSTAQTKVDSGGRRCSRCTKFKTLDDFYVCGGKFDSYCMTCRRIANKTYKRKDGWKEKRRQATSTPEFREKERERGRQRRRTPENVEYYRQYRLTPLCKYIKARSSLRAKLKRATTPNEVASLALEIRKFDQEIARLRGQRKGA